MVGDAPRLPPNDASIGHERDDRVDTELGQLLHRPLGLVALGQREPDRELDRRRRLLDDFAVDDERRSEAGRPPSTSAVGDRERRTRAQPKDAVEVMAVVVRENRRVEIVDENERFAHWLRRTPT